MTKPDVSASPARARIVIASLIAAILAVTAFIFVRSANDGASTTPRGVDAEVADAAAAMRRRRPRAAGKLDLAAVKRASISGTVTDTAGEPLAGAQVCASGSSEDVGAEVLRFPTCSRSGKDGRYAIDGLLPIEYGVSASARGYQPTTWAPHPDAKWRERRIWLGPGEARADIDLELEDGGARIAGKVRDIAGGSIEGAWISSGGAFAISDAEGTFELWTRPYEGWVQAKAEGYNDASKRVATPSEDNELFLTPESVLVGRVVMAESGEGVGGVGIEVGGSMMWFGEGPSAVTAPDGSFRVGGLGPGRYDVEARADGLYGKAPSTVPLGLTETSGEVIVEVHPMASLEADVVIAGSDEPCPAGSVWLELVDGKRRHRDRFGPNDAGKATVPAIQPGKYKIKASCDEYVSEEDYGEVEVGTAVLEPMRIEVREGLAIRGEVVDAAGEPIGEAFLRASPRMGDGTDARAHQSDASAQSRADGTFELLGLLPGTYDLKCWGGDSTVGTESPVEVKLESGADRNDVVITVDEHGSVRGTVRDATGEPLRDLQITARSKKNSGWSFGGRSSGVTDGEGRFEIATLRAGEYRVLANRGFFNALKRPGQGDDDPDGEPVTVRAGEVAELDIVVERTDGEITGRVVAGGGPVSDAFINYQRISESKAANAKSQRNSVRWGAWGKNPVLTDAEGNFTVTGLTPGRYVVQATRRGGGEGIVEDVAVGDDVTIEIDDTASVSGRVTSPGGELPPSLSVTLRDEARGLSFSESTFKRGGQFEFLEVPAGDYEISASTDNGVASTKVEVEAGDMVSGLTLELESLITVTGRVVDLETGAPVPGIAVSIGTRGTWGGGRSGGTKDNISDASGRFELRNVPTGKITVTARPRTWGGGTPEYGYFRKYTAIAPGKGSHDIGDLELVKSRTDEKDEVGDFGFKLEQADPDAEEETRELEVAFVRPGGPAAKAGMQVGSKIVKVDGIEVGGGNTNYGTLVRVKVGTEVTFELADAQTLKITAGPKP